MRDEAAKRAAIGGYYYAVFLKSRESLAHDNRLKPTGHGTNHSAVARELKKHRAAAGGAIESLVRNRERADYDPGSSVVQADVTNAKALANEVVRMCSGDWGRAAVGVGAGGCRTATEKPRRPAAYNDGESEMPKHPHQVRAEDVARLNPDDFRRLVNHLLIAEAKRFGVPLNRIRVTERNNVKDGGIDAFVDNFPDGSAYVPAGGSAWQAKGGAFPKARRLGNEIATGEDVRAAVANGATYVAACGAEAEARTQKAREDEIAAAAQDIRAGAMTAVLTAAHFAEWANEHPSALAIFGQGFPGVRTLGEIAHVPAHAGPFEADADRRRAIQGMQEFVDNTGAGTHYRVEGLAGVGKTRTVIEALQGLQDVVLYSNEYPRELIDWVMASNDRTCILVLDDLEDVTLGRRAEGEAEIAQGRLRLVTVGYGPAGGSDRNLHRLEPLDEETMRRAVKAIAPALDIGQVRFVVMFTGGYIKLAREVAVLVAKERLTNIVELGRQRQLRTILDGLFDEKERRALEALALLKRVGWDGELAAEGKALCRFFGLNWEETRDLVSRLVVRGLVTEQGRYRYVTPEVLAVMLAADVWERRASDMDDLRKQLQQLATSAAVHSFIERLAALRGVPGAERVAADFFGSGGPLKALGDLDSDEAGRVARNIACAAPEAALTGIERLFGPATPDTLMAFRAGRRQLVWLLEEASAPRATFARAQRLLAELALAENEDIANNATGVWANRFLTHLGGTDVPAKERYELLEELIRSGDRDRKLLALRALTAALSFPEYGLGYGVGAERTVPVEGWRPTTWGEDWECRRAALALLETLTTDGDPMVARKASDELITCVPGLSQVGLGREALARLGAVKPADARQQRAAWEAAHHVIRWAGERKNEELAQLARAVAGQLLGDSFSDRLRRYAGHLSWVDWREEEGLEARTKRCREIAEEAAASPKKMADTDIEWLVSGDAEHAWYFGHGLGTADLERRLKSRVLDAARAAADPRFVSGYLRALADSGAAIEAEEALDDLAGDADSAMAAFDATARGPTSRRGLERMIGLVDRGAVPALTLGMLGWRQWAREADAGGLRAAVERLLDVPGGAGVEAALAILGDRADGGPAGIDPMLIELSWRAIETPVGEPSGMYGYEWRALAMRMLEVDLRRTIAATLRLVEERGSWAATQQLEVLLEACKREPAKSWPALGKALLANRWLPWKLADYAWGVGLLEQFDQASLMRWMRRAPEKRSRVLAQLVKPGSELSELARQLIIERGHRSEAANILSANFGTGAFSGSHADREESQLKIARGWLTDPDPEVRAWAAEEVAGMETRLPRLRREEEERGI